MNKNVIAYLKAECARSGDREKKEILAFLKQHKTGFLDYPYAFTKKYNSKSITVHTDVYCGMNYVLHDGRNLYFPKQWEVQRIRWHYNTMLLEQDADSPHCCPSEGFCVEEGDVIADVGAAEAIWALSNIEYASKVYLFVCEEFWQKPLRKTFEPWKEKVAIVNKYISNKSEGIHITLDDFLNENPINVIKVDIEGAELDLLEGAKNTLRRKNLKILICTYHRAADAHDIEKILSDTSFAIEYSKGYRVCFYDPHLAAPYLRKALIRAKKISPLVLLPVFCYRIRVRFCWRALF